MHPSRVLVLAMLLAGDAANAQALNKCVSPGGAVSWQSSPCPHGTRRMRSIAYVPEDVVPVPASAQAPVARPSRHRPATGRRTSTRVHRRKPDACARAREKRESTLERVGLKRTYDLLSKLDADVRRVCR